jgi:hypothetical protein
MKRALVLVGLLILGSVLLAGAEPAGAATCALLQESGALSCSTANTRSTFSTPRPRPDSILNGKTYGWIEDYARFYETPGPDAEWARTASTGVFYGPVVQRTTDVDGNGWINIWDNWLPERFFHEVEASTFKGVEVNYHSARPFGWVLHPFQPRPAPGAPPVEGRPELQRYDFVRIYGAQMGGDGVIWYDVGEDQWVRYHNVALVKVRERPQGVGAEEYWVDVDLTQQIFAAYEGDRMVYAGLISSGLSRWPTRRGLFRVWLRYLTTDMSGGVVGDDYYYLEDVPHTMYFDDAIALHGAYWHDDFGRPKSHGCVNMPPRAAEWVYYWSLDAPGALRVWVHASNYREFLQG